MKLRTKIAIVIVSLAFLQLFTCLALYHYIYHPKINNLEAKHAKQEIQFYTQQIQQEKNSFAKQNQLLILHPWLNKKQVSTSQDKDKIKQLMQNYQLNLLAVFNKEQYIWGKILDNPNNQDFGAAGLIKDLGNNYPDFINNQNSNSINTQIAHTAFGPMYISLINLRNGKKIISGRFISNIVDNKINFVPNNLAEPVENYQHIINEFAKQPKTIALTVSDNDITAYGLINTINNNPGLYIEKQFNKNFTSISYQFLTEYMTVIIVASLLYLLVVFQLLYRWVIKPAQLYINFVNKADKEFTSPNVNSRYAGEIGNLGKALNQLMSKNQLKLATDTAHAYREGTYHSRKQILDLLEKTLIPAINSAEQVEKILNELPLNQLEKAIANTIHNNTNKGNTDELAYIVASNNELRENIDILRKEIENLRGHIIRNATTVKAQSRSLGAMRPFTT